MIKLFNKIKKMFTNSNQQLEILTRIIALENEIATIEKTNLVVLAKLLHAYQPAMQNNKIDNKNTVILSSRKDQNAGNPPTYH